MNAFYETHDEHFFTLRRRGMIFPLHLHAQLELYYLNSGMARVQVQQETRVMQAGELAIIFPNQIHSYQALEPSTECSLIICDLEYTGGYAQTLLGNQPSNAFIEKEHIHPNVRYAMEALIGENDAESAAVPHLVQLILSRLLPKISLIRTVHAGKQELSNQLVQYIALHFRETLTLDSLAKALNVSKYHLSHVFSTRIKESFPSYLANIRISYACGKLRDTAGNITEIAMEAGFESYRTFIRVFRERVGMTPVEYRKLTQLSKVKGC